MKQANPQTVYLKDYQPPAYWVDRVELRFEPVDHRLRPVPQRIDGEHQRPLVEQGDEARHVGALLVRRQADGQLALGDTRLLQAVVAKGHWVTNRLDAHLVDGDITRIVAGLDIGHFVAVHGQFKRSVG